MRSEVALARVAIAQTQRALLVELSLSKRKDAGIASITKHY